LNKPTPSNCILHKLQPSRAGRTSAQLCFFGRLTYPCPDFFF
jgi:hypothetical protein